MFFSTVDSHGILNPVPCALRQGPVVDPSRVE